ncbi:MAG TPA: hypothetical protein VGD43_05670, partial [Micromonospora sp.]
QVRWMLETQIAVSGRQPDVVTAFGGPTANPSWMWIKAVLSPVPLVVLPGHQGASLGAAQLAGRAAGLGDLAVPPRPSPPATGPAPEWEHRYRSLFLPLVRASGQPATGTAPTPARPGPPTDVHQPADPAPEEPS